MGRNAPALVKAEADIIALQRRIEERARALQAVRVNAGAGQAQVAVALTPGELMNRREELMTLREGTNQALAAALADAAAVREREQAVAASDNRIARARTDVESLLAAGALPLSFARSDGGATRAAATRPPCSAPSRAACSP
jgi:hypothetical protein